MKSLVSAIDFNGLNVLMDKENDRSDDTKDNYGVENQICVKPRLNGIKHTVEHRNPNAFGFQTFDFCPSSRQIFQTEHPKTERKHSVFGCF